MSYSYLFPLHLNTYMVWWVYSHCKYFTIWDRHMYLNVFGRQILTKVDPRAKMIKVIFLCVCVQCCFVKASFSRKCCWTHASIYHVPYSQVLTHHVTAYPAKCYIPANTKHLYNICTTSAQRLRRWSKIVLMLYKSFVYMGIYLNKYTRSWAISWNTAFFVTN